jgi:hypothetical protein
VSLGTCLWKAEVADPSCCRLRSQDHTGRDEFNVHSLYDEECRDNFAGGNCPVCLIMTPWKETGLTRWVSEEPPPPLLHSKPPLSHSKPRR